MPLKLGDRVPAGKALGVERAEKTLVVYTSSECHFCVESLPFYRRLAQAAKRKVVRVVAVSWEEPEINKAFLAASGISVDAAHSLEATHLPLAGTPTLVLIKRDSTAIKTWEGRLDSKAENNVLHLIATGE